MFNTRRKKKRRGSEGIVSHPTVSDGDEQLCPSNCTLVISQPAGYFLTRLHLIPASKYSLKHYGPSISPPEFCSPWLTPPPRLCGSCYGKDIRMNSYGMDIRLIVENLKAIRSSI
jgi:hypothetical protein